MSWTPSAIDLDTASTAAKRLLVFFVKNGDNLLRGFEIDIQRVGVSLFGDELGEVGSHRKTVASGQ